MNSKYQIVNHEYLTTGCHLMVTICDVYFPAEHQLMFVYVCDGYAMLFSRDYLRSDDEPDDYDSILIDSWQYFDYEVCDSKQYKELLEECKKIHEEYTAAEFSHK